MRVNRVLIANRRRLFKRKYQISEDSKKLPLENTGNDSDLKNAILDVSNNGAADVNLEGVDVVRREALRKHIIMSGAIEECAASLRTTLVRHISLHIPS